MDLEVPKRRYRMILDFKCQFPEKLYDVANDGQLIKWNRNGSVSISSEEEFEENVMKWYPGFLQIPSFLNFKRLFREYGFDRGLRDDGELEWSHPLFIRGRRDLVKQIRTRRKSHLTQVFLNGGSVSHSEESLVIPTEKHRRYSVRKRKKTKPFDATTGRKLDLGGGGDVGSSQPNTPGSYVIKQPHAMQMGYSVPVEKQQQGNVLQNSVQHPVPMEINMNTNAVPNNFNPNRMMENFAQAEFNEEEYKKWIENKRKLDDQKAAAERKAENSNQEKQTTKSSEYWWMYENKTGGDIVQTVNLSTGQSSSSGGQQGEGCTPCGFCKCCSAISNYVHLFGEVPENIQVIDYLEEVVE